MAVQAKICGLSTAEAVTAAVSAGAGLVGFMFFPPSPRNIAITDAAGLAQAVPPVVKRVGVLVNPGDDHIDAVLDDVALDYLQLHGEESPERVADIRMRTHLPIIKVLKIASPADLTEARAYETIADMLLLDAKPPEGADRPGGHGAPFDWDILRGFRSPLPWMLGGGLSAENVAQAIDRTGARMVDVSSGVEAAPGIKDIGRIQAFLKAVEVVNTDD